MSDYGEYEIEGFAKEMIRAYNNRTYLSELTNRKFYDSQRHEEDGFVQIGGRYSELQGEWFDPNAKGWIREGLPHQLISTLIRGELNYLVDKLNEFNQEVGFESDEIKESFSFEELKNLLDENLGKTHLIVPNRYGRDLIDWSLRNEYSVENVDSKGSRIFEVGHGARVVVASEKIDLDKIILIDKHNLSLIQKTRENKPAEEEEIDLINEYKNLGDKEPLMLYFGKSKKPKDLDFLFRTVIKLEKPKSNAVSTVELVEDN